MKDKRHETTDSGSSGEHLAGGCGGENDEVPAPEDLQQYLDDRFADTDDYDADAAAEVIDALASVSLTLCDAVAADLDQNRRLGVEFDERAARGEFRTTELPDIMGDEFSMAEADDDDLDGAEAMLVIVESVMADRCDDVTREWIDVFGVDHLFEIVRADG